MDSVNQLLIVKLPFHSTSNCFELSLIMLMVHQSSSVLRLLSKVMLKETSMGPEEQYEEKLKRSREQREMKKEQ